MSSLLPDFARPRAYASVLVLLIPLFLWTGCTPDAPSERLLGPADTLFTASEEERAAALAVLDSIQQHAMERAFERLPQYAFTRHVRTAHLGPGDSLLAMRERVLRFPPPDSAERPLVLQADSAGDFSLGGLGRLAPSGNDDRAPTALGRHALPSDPPYLDPRTYEAFRYRLRPDTLAGRPVRRVDVHAQPGELGADQAIRHARLYVDPASYELIGLYLVRGTSGVLFREDSRSYVQLRPAPDSGWVPAAARFHAHVKIPLRAPRTLRTTSVFYGYRAVE